MRHTRSVRRWSLPALLLAGAAGVHPVQAQQDTSRIPTGVRLGITYAALQRPKLAVRPFTGAAQAAAIARQATEIVQRDLDFSDRFAMAADVPSAMLSGNVDYRAWDGLNVVYLVAGEVAPSGGGYRLQISLHDVVYKGVKQSQAFQLPSPASPDFRLAIHAASDEIVRWITGQPGMAATRIAFVRRNADGTYAIATVDSDGQNVQTVASARGYLYSPTWGPQGAKMAFTRQVGGRWELVERDMGTGSARVLLTQTQILTPAYSPDGRRIVFSTWNGRGHEINDYDVAQRCCLRRLTRSVRTDQYPSYSPDGRRIVFHSDRIGQPHIYVMDAEGGEADLISPYTYGEPGYYTSPDWSPSGTQIAFHGRSRGQFQVMIADVSRRGAAVQQITASGRSEDPSWAPDGRHIVFGGVREEGSGLYVVDTVTGRLRPLLMGARYLMPEWSPSLVLAMAAGAAQR